MFAVLQNRRRLTRRFPGFQVSRFPGFQEKGYNQGDSKTTQIYNPGKNLEHVVHSLRKHQSYAQLFSHNELHSIIVLPLKPWSLLLFITYGWIAGAVFLFKCYAANLLQKFKQLFNLLYPVHGIDIQPGKPAVAVGQLALTPGTDLNRASKGMEFSNSCVA
jgi:hypothetical protein